MHFAMHRRGVQTLLRGLTARGLDVASRPMVRKYVFDEVLRMPQQEFLEGATHAAQVVCDAISASTHGDDDLLTTLRADDLLETRLAASIAEKILSRRRRLGSMPEKWDLRLESDVETTGRAWLQHTRLIVGAQRSTFELSKKAWVELGAQLVVCGDRCAWQLPPLELDAARRLGCTVQCTVLFDSRPPLSAGKPPEVYPHLPQNATPQSFTFEAELAAPSTGAERGQQELAFRIVDVNGLAKDGIAFWSDADALDPMEVLYSSRQDV